jgi:tetratricopeptide (TPR) repeat protein
VIAIGGQIVQQSDFDELQRLVQSVVRAATTGEAGLEAVRVAVERGLMDALLADAQLEDWVRVIHSVVVEASDMSRADRLILAWIAFAVAQRVLKVGASMADAAWRLVEADAVCDVAFALDPYELQLSRGFYHEAAEVYAIAGVPQFAGNSFVAEAKCAMRLGAVDEAIALCESATVMLTQPKFSVDYARCLEVHASGLAQLGKSCLAVGLYEQAESILRPAGRPRDLAGCLVNHATCLQQIGRPSEALSLYAEGETLLRAEGAGADLGICVMNSAGCLERLGRYMEAVSRYEAAEELLRDSEVSNEYARCVMNYAGCLVQLGRFAAALPWYARAVAQFRRSGLPKDRGDVALKQGICLAGLGRLREALRLFEAAEAYLGRAGLPVDRAECQMNHANCLQQIGLFSDAVRLYRQAEAIFERDGLPDSHARCLTNRAYCLERSGSLNEALSLYDRALPILALSDSKVSYASALMNHGNCLRSLGRPEQALDKYNDAITVCKSIGEAGEEVRWRVCLNLGLLLVEADRGDVAQAQDLVSEAIGIVEARAVRTGRVPDRISVRETYADAYRIAVRIDLFLEDITAAYDHVQQAKGRALLELMTPGQKRGGAGPELGELQQKEYELVSRLGEVGGSPAGEDYRELSDIRSRRRELIRRLAEECPEEALEAFGEVRSLTEIQSVLKEGEVLVDMLDVGPAVVAFLVTTTGLDLAWQVSRLELESVLDRWDDVVDSQDVTSGIADLSDLYELLISPFLGRLSDVRRIILSPSGLLHRVPFAALCRIGGGGAIRYLSEEFEICLTPIGTSLWILRHRTRAEGPPSLLAAAPFATTTTPTRKRSAPLVAERGGSGVRAVSELPWSGWEVEGVSAVHAKYAARGDQHILKGTMATKDSVERLAPPTALVLLATHGGVTDTGVGVPDFALLFESDGHGWYREMRMREIFGGQLSLQRAVSIALTACQTAQVALHGEEAMGFQQAFCAAGALVCLAPLWAIDDEAAAVLSVAYHRAFLAEGVSAAKAIQKAMEEVRSTPGWEHPVFWAAMLPSGDGATVLST